MIDKVFSLPEPFEMLVIDDGSPDGTAAIVRSAGRSSRRGSTSWNGPGNWAWARPASRDSARDWRTDSTTSARWTATFRTTPTIWCASPRRRRGQRRGGRFALRAGRQRGQLAHVAPSDVPTSPRCTCASSRMPLRDATAGFICYSRRALETIDPDARPHEGATGSRSR